MPERKLPSPGVRFPPPIIFVAGLATAALLHSRWPLPIWPPARPFVLLLVAYALVLAGLAWMAWGLITFRHARTAIFPNHPATRIVTAGPYRFGRNPMYLGMSAVYWGVALWLNSLWAVLIFPVVIALLFRFVIRREERYLAQAFGVDYERYRGRVPRWLGLRGPTSP